MQRRPGLEKHPDTRLPSTGTGTHSKPLRQIVAESQCQDDRYERYAAMTSVFLEPSETIPIPCSDACKVLAFLQGTDMRCDETYRPDHCWHRHHWWSRSRGQYHQDLQ